MERNGVYDRRASFGSTFYSNIELPPALFLAFFSLFSHESELALIRFGLDILTSTS